MLEESVVHRCVPVVVVAVMLAAAGVHAHGDWPPKHGGVMNDGGETSFELVARGRTAVLHVEDHGTPIPTRGAKGILTITRSNQTWTSEVRAVGGNRLETKLPQLLVRGDRVLARITMSNGSVAAGRFVIK